VDGIIVGASSGGPDAVLGKRWQHLPLVFVNNEHIAPDDALLDAGQAAARAAAYLVSNDDMRGAATMTEHLLALGHRRIGYIGAAGRASSLRRQHGFQQTLQRAGLPYDESLVVVLDEGSNEGELAAFRLLSRANRPTALFCYDDVMALGALRAIRALNLRVPEDVSVVGFDGIPLAAYFDPPLTTVRQPMYEMGQQAMMTLLRLFGGEEAPRVTVMHGDLIIRASSRAVAWHGSPGPADRVLP
jgi:DNA-binding LacI/PurR family transcriptional regulator